MRPLSKCRPLTLATMLAVAACGASQSANPGTSPLVHGDCQIFGTMSRPEDLERKDFWDYYARYDLVLAATTPGTVQPLRDRNPQIRVLANVNPYFALGVPFWPDHVNRPEVEQPEWVLRDERGEPIRYSGALYHGMNPADLPTMMDVRHPDWQRHFLDWTARVVREEQLDGVFLDTFSAGYPDFCLTRDGKPCRDFAAPAWKQSAQEFLAMIRARFAPPLQVVFNGISVAPGGSGLGDAAFLQQADGACYEAFSIAWPIDRDDASRQWYFDHAIQQAMVTCRQQGKSFLLQATGDAANEQTRLYALGCFLLQKYEGAWFYFAPDEATSYWYPEWDLRLGAARGDARQLGGIWVREYAHARVFANPGGSAATLALEREYSDWKGARVRTLALAPWSATILRR